MLDCLDLETLLGGPYLEPELGFDIFPNGSAHLPPGSGYVLQ